MDGKWNIAPESIKDPKVQKDMDDRWKRAKSVMEQRTAGHALFARIAHNQSIYERNKDDVYSEGSTQGIKRKIRAQTIQRVPDGEISTQFDKNSIEQVETEFIFKNKVISSEFQGADMLKNLWETFGASYDYGYACVRTGFKRDVDGDVRCSYTIIGWNDVYPAPDCKSIESAEWYIIREYISRSELEALLTEEGGLKDSTYNEDVVKYLVENQSTDGIDPKSMPLADRKKAVTPRESVEIRTLYKRGDSEFITYVPSCGAILRTVRNYDPRKDLPLHFMILDPDAEFPLGCSSVMWTMGQQQFADAFLTLSYQTLLLAHQPPLMGFGNLTPSKIKMKPRAFWPMGTNPNNKIEKFPVETTSLTQYGSILENVQGRMMAALNIADGTVASEAHTMNYSKTPQGVDQQRQDKTVTVNQYQKRVEVFFSEWANHAIRSYINAMSGVHELTVDEETRRKIWDIEMSQANDDGSMSKSIIDGDKIKIDFDNLSTDLLSFEVRTGSLIESERDTERNAIQEALIPISQMIGSLSEQNKAAFEKVLMRLVTRLLELSDIDVSQETANMVNEQLLMGAMQATMEQVMGQQQQLNGLQAQMQQMLPQAQEMPAEEPGAMMPGAPEEQMPMLPEQSIPPITASDIEPGIEEMPDEQMMLE